MQTKKFLSNLSVKRIIKVAGGERVSVGACLELEKTLVEHALLIGKLAIENAKCEGRKSIKDKDIKEAVKEIKEHF